MKIIQQNIVHFIGRAQLAVMLEGLRGEEGDWFVQKLADLTQIINSIPVTGETDGQGFDATVHLHYFLGGWDWYVTERDIGDNGRKEDPIGPQHQAFGYVCGHEDELGYISIPELLTLGAELDLHWAPKPLSKIIEERRSKAA